MVSGPVVTTIIAVLRSGPASIYKLAHEALCTVRMVRSYLSALLGQGGGVFDVVRYGKRLWRLVGP